LNETLKPLLVYALDDVESSVERLADRVPTSIAIVETSTSRQDFIKRIKHLQEGPHVPDVVVLDAYLERQGGYDGAFRAAEAVRQNPVTSGLPILIFSAFSHYIRAGAEGDKGDGDAGREARLEEFKKVKDRFAKLDIYTEHDYFDKNKDAAGHPDLNKGIEELIERLRAIQKEKAASDALETINHMRAQK
jgi:CheY-like chemotaxis protein